MQYKTREILLKDGKIAVFRSPAIEDAAEMAAYLKTTAEETDFLLRTPEECSTTIEQEEAFLESVINSDHSLMIACTVDGVIAGNCRLDFNNRRKTRHRASVGIGLLARFWNLGIGTAMFLEMKRIAREKGVEYLELEYIEGNDRARHLYEKMGFVQVGEKQDAIRLPDGRSLSEYSMMCKL